MEKTTKKKKKKKKKGKKQKKKKKKNRSIPWRRPADGPSLIGKQLSARLWVKSAYGLGE